MAPQAYTQHPSQASKLGMTSHLQGLHAWAMGRTRRQVSCLGHMQGADDSQPGDGRPSRLSLFPDWAWGAETEGLVPQGLPVVGQGQRLGSRTESPLP